MSVYLQAVVACGRLSGAGLKIRRGDLGSLGIEEQNIVCSLEAEGALDRIQKLHQPAKSKAVRKLSQMIRRAREARDPAAALEARLMVRLALREACALRTRVEVCPGWIKALAIRDAERREMRVRPASRRKWGPR